VTRATLYRLMKPLVLLLFVVEFGLQDLPTLFGEAGFADVEQLGVHFLMIGFVRAESLPPGCSRRSLHFHGTCKR
jgi:hypothetical protein